MGLSGQTDELELLPLDIFVLLYPLPSDQRSVLWIRILRTKINPKCSFVGKIKWEKRGETKRGREGVFGGQRSGKMDIIASLQFPLTLLKGDVKGFVDIVIEQQPQLLSQSDPALSKRFFEIQSRVPQVLQQISGVVSSNAILNTKCQNLILAVTTTISEASGIVFGGPLDQTKIDWLLSNLKTVEATVSNMLSEESQVGIEPFIDDIYFIQSTQPRPETDTV